MVKRSQSQWGALFAEHESSGLSAAEFCRRQSLCPKHFSVRKRQLGWKSSSSFVQVKPAISKVVTPESEVRIRVVDVSVPTDRLEGVLAELLR